MFTHLQHLLPRLRRRYDDFLENVLAIPASGSADFTFEEAEVARLHEATAAGRTLSADGMLRAGLAEACAPLRRARVEVATILFAPAPAKAEPWWTRCLGLLGPAFLLAVLASFGWPLAWAAAGLLGVLLVAASIGYSKAVRVWEMEAEALQLMLFTCGALGTRDDGVCERFRELRGKANRLRRLLSRSTVVMTVPGLKEYVNWFLLGDVRHCLAGRRKLRANLPALRECFLLCRHLPDR